MIQDEVRYKRPFLGNGQNLSDAQHPHNEQLYVFPCFMRPGRQNFVVIADDGIGNQTEETLDMPDDQDLYYIHKCIVENREEDVCEFSKPLMTKKKERKFILEESVFKDWKPDTKHTLEKCLEHDMQFWKLTRLIKIEEEQEIVKELIKKYFPKLKEVYHFLLSKSRYPNIERYDFIEWAK